MPRQQPRFVAELQEFVRIPSISADPARAVEVHRCAAWLAAHLKRIGLEQICSVPTQGHPIITGSWLHAEGQPTMKGTAVW